MGEVFVPIVGFEENYEISNFGRIKYKNYLHHKNKVKYSYGVKLSNGYLKCYLTKNGLIYQKLIHVLVAEHFIPNTNNKPCVNHIDFNRQNNTFLNLEWCDYQENYIHSISKSRLGIKPVIQFDLNGNKVNEFKSISEIERILGFSKANISKHILKIKYIDKCYGYVWKCKQ